MCKEHWSHARRPVGHEHTHKLYYTSKLIPSEEHRSYPPLLVLWRLHQNASIHALIYSKLDNTYSLLVGLLDCVLKKLQLIQNNATRLVPRKKKDDYVTPLIKQLHCLSIKSRITFTISLLPYKALHGLAPPHQSYHRNSSKRCALK